ncbi:MAG: nucleotide sugar dehydrogenase [Thermoplasmatales archaeon]|nr:nucleotide sugar dehydrogenase [Thermoplasmatales archaeon]MCK4995384.1 nucleotide sugar dehydrogenase [Thermoplasmatales archaeon]
MKGEKVCCIIGLGYVGLPLAYLCIKKGYKVSGYDVDKEKISLINHNKIPIKDFTIEKSFGKYLKKLKATSNPKIIKEADIVVVCVPTPVDSNHNPNLKALKNAVNIISKNLTKGKLIIIESTIYPGVMEEIVKPELEKTGFVEGKDFYLSHCPERIDPGNKKWDIESIARVFGSFSKKGEQLTEKFYRSILKSKIKKTSSIKVAEAIKIVENIFRDVNIALVNELARSFEKLDIDVLETIEGAATKPFAFMPHYPGCGVGGHCIPVDPYYLIDKSKKVGFEHRFLSLARSINNNMPMHTINRCIEGLNEVKKSIKGTKIAVLGVSYKKDIDDIRNSPSFKIIKELKKHGAEILVYDPHYTEKNTYNNINKTFEKAECVVVVTDHTEFKELNYDIFKENNIRVIVDGRNIFDKRKITRMGIIYKGIGR